VPVEPPSALGFLGAGRDLVQARAGIGLGERECRDAFTPRDLAQDFAAQLRLRAERERMRAEALHDEHDVEHAAVIRELVADRAQCAHRDSRWIGELTGIRAAVAARHGPSREAGLAHDRERGVRGACLVETVERRRALSGAPRELRELVEFPIHALRFLRADLSSRRGFARETALALLSRDRAALAFAFDRALSALFPLDRRLADGLALDRAAACDFAVERSLSSARGQFFTKSGERFSTNAAYDSW